ncbi:phosphoadenosine phosphosulfate reductase [Yoonia maritima]|uniref:phosphoadenosine phosphosulfate reductase n=1 Tax=Yoonia maritima TaxID=1435347 RepID=UPI000D0FA424|nr:phosphoadenosine phosphosulfate reductase [Yoonia maritima]
MIDRQSAFVTNLANLSQNAWLGEIDDICDELGFFEQLGRSHCAAFLEAGNNLLVTFENIPDVQEHNPDAEPRGFPFTRNEGWSHLALLSFDAGWFRDEAVIDFFDRMTDDAFFEDFENIVFFGANNAGYAAAAFSLASPGSTIVALNPQATLEPISAGWDTRFRTARRTDFSGPYGYAPDMIEGAKEVFVAFDPQERLDACHAALFRKPHVTLLPCPLMGGELDRTFDRLGILEVIIKLAMAGSLTAKRFHQLLRARRYDDVYGQDLVSHLVRSNHTGLARVICEYKLQRGKNPFYAKTLADLAR